MNVLIYSNTGASVHCVQQTKEVLRALLSPVYAVSTVTAKQLLDEPWADVTAMLVIPGGRDLPYCRDLKGEGIRKIREYVSAGGIYFGICAGAYFAADSLEFEKGTPLEVSGPRDLKFFPGVARGAAFHGFSYGTESGTRAVPVRFGDKIVPTYFNGGCVFDSPPRSDVEVLAEYADPVELEDGCQVAAVLCKFGSGRALLTGMHLEYSPALPEEGEDDDPVASNVRAVLQSSVVERYDVLRCMLLRAGLKLPTSPEQSQIADSASGQPSETQQDFVLSPILVTSTKSLQPTTVQLSNALEPLLDATATLHDAEDAFEIRKPGQLLSIPGGTLLQIYEPGVIPSMVETPYFDHERYYRELSAVSTTPTLPSLGALLAYGEVVTSTSSLLDRNPKFLSAVPHGTVAVGTVQTAGRGRGSNVWVNPAGVLAVSGVLKVRQAELRHSLVFIQYLVTLAMVETINSFGPGFRALDVGIKWPNDLYIRRPEDQAGAEFVKIGGVIVSVNVIANEYVLVFGSGTNVSNPHPTTSLNSVGAKRGLPPIPIETLLARFLIRLGEMFHIFCARGFTPFEQRYYDSWLHNNAVVTLERYGNARAVIRGISPEGGMLLVEALDAAGNPTNVRYELQPDGNSFDMFRGLIRKKV